MRNLLNKLWESSGPGFFLAQFNVDKWQVRGVLGMF
jgi:hypothetical protein